MQSALLPNRLLWPNLALAVILALGITMLLGAMLYQHVLDYPPCSVCIKIRIAVMAAVVIAGLGLLLRRWIAARCIVAIALLAAIYQFAKLSIEAYRIEAGLSQGACSFAVDYPKWLPMDQIWPGMFEALVGCGYTPILAFNVSMAQVLVTISIVQAALCGFYSISAILVDRD